MTRRSRGRNGRGRRRDYGGGRGGQFHPRVTIPRDAEGYNARRRSYEETAVTFREFFSSDEMVQRFAHLRQVHGFVFRKSRMRYMLSACLDMCLEIYCVENDNYAFMQVSNRMTDEEVAGFFLFLTDDNHTDFVRDLLATNEDLTLMARLVDARYTPYIGETFFNRARLLLEAEEERWNAWRRRH